MHVQRLLQRLRWRYWTIRAWAEGWVLVLVRRGPRAFWRRLTHAPYRSALCFGFSTIAQGYHPEPDVAVVLTPPGPFEPDPSIISPRRVRAFVRAMAPGTPPDPRLDALVALEEEHGLRPLMVYRWPAGRLDGVVGAPLAGGVCIGTSRDEERATSASDNSTIGTTDSDPPRRHRSD